jgi:hypothetical protein
MSFSLLKKLYVYKVHHFTKKNLVVFVTVDFVIILIINTIASHQEKYKDIFYR